MRFFRIALLLASMAANMAFTLRIGAAADVSATTKLVSDHVFRGQRLSGASLQPAIDFSSGDFSAGIGGSLPIENRAANQPGAELGLYASYRHPLNATTHLTPGVAAYFYRHSPVRSGYRRAIFEPNLALSHTLAGVRFTSTVYYDLTRRGPTVDLTADVALPLTKLGTELDLAASIGGYRLRDAAESGRPKTRSDGNHWSLSAMVPFQVSFGSKIQIGVAYTAAFDAEIKDSASAQRNPLATRRAVAQLDYTYFF